MKSPREFKKMTPLIAPILLAAISASHPACAESFGSSFLGNSADSAVAGTVGVKPTTKAVAPSITAQTDSLVSCAGSTIRLTVITSGTSLNYQWLSGSVGSRIYTNLFDQGNISGVNSPVLTISNAATANKGDYIVIVKNQAGSASSATPTTVDIRALFVSGVMPASAMLYPGGNVHFTVRVTGASPLSYRWRKNGKPLRDKGNISGSGTGALVIRNANGLDAAAYDVVVSNAYGSATSPPAILTLLNAPTAGSYSQEVFSRGAVAHWRFNELNGTNAYDFVGGHTAIYGSKSSVGATAGSAPRTSPAVKSVNTAVGIHYPDRDSAVQVPAGVGLNLNTNTVTITGWFYPVYDPTTHAGLVLQHDDSGVTGLTINRKGNLGYTWNNDGVTKNYDSGLSLPQGLWSFVALVVTPTNATFHRYNADGQAIAVFSHNHQNAPFSGRIVIGDDPLFEDGTRVFDGYIDEVAIFNRSLAGAEVARLFSIASGILVAPGITSQAVSQTVLEGNNIQFAANVAGSEPLSCQWWKDGAKVANEKDVSGANTATLSLNNVGLGRGGDYTVVATNPSGSVTSSVATLTVLVRTNYFESVMALSPLGFWRLNEADGVVAEDSSGNELDGAYQSAVKMGSAGADFPPNLGFGAGNRGALLNGRTNSWVSLRELNLHSDVATFTAWINPTSATQPGLAGLIFCRGGGASGFGFNSDGTQLGYTWNGDSGTYNWDSGLKPPANQWSFVALVITPTDATVYLYNTTGQSSARIKHAHAPSAFSGETRIGNDAYAARRTFKGTVDEVAIFDSALTPGQIQQLYVSGTMGAPLRPATR